jgi:ribosome-binding protein aMBF1 (putative translation factor)
VVYFFSIADASGMEKQAIRRGRPRGSSTYDAESAIAFGAAVREERLRQGIAQETLSHLAGVERSHLGKIERGEHVPTLPVILKLSRALKCRAGLLLAATEDKLLSSDHHAKQ